MIQSDTKSRFKAKLLRPANAGSNATWAFVVLPKSASARLPRRGRTTVMAIVNGHDFQATLEPDGQLSHWLRVDKELLETTNIAIGDTVTFEISPVEQEPEPEIPSDLQDALLSAPDARTTWDDTTTIARLDWIHWITSAKQPKTRTKRIVDACNMLASGKRRVCCFDPSGYYSKTFSAPEAEER
ncbi:MAG: DUF1905 domain-containing protein [Abitibacteriaceae bacterium]|nr:DUF1905 domain-containing protein [Abditibacteriaceae bacterium]